MADVDQSAAQEDPEQKATDGAEEMEIDAQGSKMKPVKARPEKAGAKRREHKVSKRKSKNSIVFASERARKAKMASKGKTKR